MLAIITSSIISFFISPLFFVYSNYENNVKILYFKEPRFSALYGLIFGIIAFILSFLILELNMFSNMFPSFENYPWIIAIIIGLGTKYVIGLISLEIKGKEYGIKAIPKIVEDNIKKRMNDTVNCYFEVKVNVLVRYIKDNKIHNIDSVIDEILPIQIKGADRKKYIREFKLLKTNYLKLMYLGVNFGETVYNSFERRIKE